MHKLNFGQFREKSMEWAALNEPCYHTWIIRKGAHNVHFHGAAHKRFCDITARGHSLKLKAYCQTCEAAVATGMVVAEDAKSRVKDVFFHCAECASKDGLNLLPPSLLIWPIMRMRDRFGAKSVRTALLCACGVPMLEDGTQEAMQAFFDDPGNFTIPVPVPVVASKPVPPVALVAPPKVKVPAQVAESKKAT
jgi:hypothetical protein